MVNKESVYQEKQIHLAQKRTELAFERTVLSYVRTSTTLILFGLAFLGFSEAAYDFFFYTGGLAIILGLLIVIITILRSIKHSKEIRVITKFFEKVFDVKKLL